MELNNKNWNNNYIVNIRFIYPKISNNIMTEIITTGVIRTYHDNAKTKLKKEYFIHNNKIEGSYKLYHDNGQLWHEVNYIDDKMNWIYKKYYENGQLESEVNYIDDLKQ